MPATSALIKVLKAAAEQGSDVIQVTSAVAALDAHHALDVESLRPKAGLHPQWVLAQQAAGAAHALFAVRFCHDDPTLLEIARTTGRITVLEAIAKSRYASAATKVAAHANLNAKRAQARPAQANRAQARRNAPQLGDVALPEELNVFGLPPLSRRHPLTRVNERAARANATPELVDALVDFAMELNAASSVEQIFSDCYGRPNDEPTTALWAMMTRHPVELLDRLPVASRPQILNNIINRLGYYSGDTPRMLWDTRLVKAIVARAHVTNLRDCGTLKARSPLFTPSAYAYLLTEPKWRKLALAHLPNSRQLKTLLRLLESEKDDPKSMKEPLSEHVEYFNSERGLFLTARDYKGPGHDEIPKGVFCLENAAKIAEGPNDQLFIKALENATSPEVADYLGDGLYFGQDSDHTYPEVTDVVALASRLDNSPDTIAKLRESGLYQSSEAYVKTVVDVVPVLWECAVNNHEHAETIMERLLAEATLNKVSEAIGQELAPMTLVQALAYLH